MSETLSDYFGSNVEFQERVDLVTKIKALKIAEAMTGWEVDTLDAVFRDGLHDSGSTPCKNSRASLLEKGVICITCWKDSDYCFSVTYPLGYHVVNAVSAIRRKPNLAKCA